MRKIVIVVGRFPVRSETFVVEHAVGLARRGWDVTVISVGCGAHITTAELASIDATGVRRVYCGNLSGSIGKKFWKVLRIVWQRPSVLRCLVSPHPWTYANLLMAAKYLIHLGRLKPDVTYVHWAHVAAPICRVSPRLPMIVTWHGYDANFVPRQRGEHCYQHLFACVHKHTVGSDFIRQRVIKLGCEKQDISLIPMGVRLQDFPYVDRSGRKNEVMTVVSVGRLVEFKGHEYLIRAVGVLKARGVLIRLKIAGDGDLRCSLESLITSLGFEGDVELLGAVPSDQICQLLHDSDVFALTGVTSSCGGVEGQGVVVIEAQATGLPVVTCNSGGLSDGILDGETGLLCSPKNVDDIVRALQRYLDNPELRLCHGQRARKFVEEKFSIETMLDSFEAVYAANTGRQRVVRN